MIPFLDLQWCKKCNLNDKVNGTYSNNKWMDR